jgi:hypothetical protein
VLRYSAPARGYGRVSGEKRAAVRRAAKSLRAVIRVSQLRRKICLGDGEMGRAEQH